MIQDRVTLSSSHMYSLRVENDCLHVVLIDPLLNVAGVFLIIKNPSHGPRKKSQRAGQEDPINLNLAEGHGLTKAMKALRLSRGGGAFRDNLPGPFNESLVHSTNLDR